MRILIAAVMVVCVSVPASATSLLFDFGHTNEQTNPNWNNVVPATTTLFALFDDAGDIYNPGSGFEITDTFFQTGEPSTGGSEAPSGDAASYPVTATDDYFFGHVQPFAGADPNPLGQFKLFGLEADKSYDFTFFASRTTGEIRDAQYTVEGDISMMGVLDAMNNNSNVLRLNGIKPDGNNEIVVSVEPGPNNENSVGFFYIGLMEVNVVPEPSTACLLLTSLIVPALLRRTRRHS